MTDRRAEADRRHQERMHLNDVLTRAEERTAARLREHLADREKRRTPEASDPDAEYGTCPECGRAFQITKRGVLRHHRKPRPAGSRYATPRCPGAGQKPTEEPQ